MAHHGPRASAAAATAMVAIAANAAHEMPTVLPTVAKAR